MTNLNNQMGEEIEITINAKLSKEEKQELVNVAGGDKQMIRYLCDQYYQSQAYRIKAENQARSLMQGYDVATSNGINNHPQFIERELNNARHQEALNKKYIDILTDTIPVCKWMKSITGIGPILSAYIYASFDVRKGSYATDFLSYAGLNDNKNPWLGNVKAKALVKEALSYRDKRFNPINDALIKHFVWCGGKEDKVADFYKKLGNAIKKSYKEDSTNITDRLYNIVDEIINKITKASYSDSESVLIDFGPDSYEFLMTLMDNNYCGDILYSYCAKQTTRKIVNIKKGTINTCNSKSSKKTYPSVVDLESYLAKPPYNTELKKRMFLVGDMFIKQSGRDKSLYGKIYKERRNLELMKNENGDYADQAARILSDKNFDKSTTTYKELSEGRLSAAHINARARRYAVKLFISHVFEAMYFAEFHEEPPKAYVIQYMGHHDYIAPEVDYKKFIK